MATNGWLVELAKRHLDYPTTVKDEATLKAYINELENHTNHNPNDINFSIRPEPKTGFGVVTCRESACNQAKIKLIARKTLTDGGKSIGLGSLGPYRVHAAREAHVESREFRMALNPLAGPRTPGNSPAKSKPGRKSSEKRQRIEKILATSPFKSGPRPPLSQPSTPARTTNTAALRPPNSAPGPSRVRRSVTPVAGPSRSSPRMSLTPTPEHIPMDPQTPPPPPRKRKSSISLNATQSEEIRDPTPEDFLPQPTKLAKVNGPSGPVRTTPSRDVSQSPSQLEPSVDPQPVASESNVQLPAFSAMQEDSDFDGIADGVPQLQRERSSEPVESVLRSNVSIPARAFSAMQEGSDSDGITGGVLQLQHQHQYQSEPIEPGPNMPLTVYSAMQEDSDDDSMDDSVPQPQPVASGSNVQLEDQPVRRTLAEAIDGEMYHMGMFTGHNIPPSTPGRGAPSGSPENGGDLDMLDDDTEMATQDPVQPFFVGADGLGYRRYVTEAGNAELLGESTDVNDALSALGLRSLNERLPGMKTVLMPHQVIGVAWLVNQERNSPFKGGILADDMGLGKTIQLLGLMARHQPRVGLTPKKSTLIVTPVSVLEQWQGEFEKHTNMGLRILKYHGQSKPKTLEVLQSYDVVITTYDTVLYDWAGYPALRQKRLGILGDSAVDPSLVTPQGKTWVPGNLLHNIKVFRVILDEAHIIRNRNSYKSEAVAALPGSYRLCLTGTPIVNALEDTYPYFRFLRLRPWNDWREFHDKILGMHSKTYPEGATRRLRKYLKPVILRRTKDSRLNGKPLITLPPKTIELVWLEFSTEERHVYTMVERQCQIIFNRFLREDTVLKNYMSVLAMLHCLREVCSHAALITRDGSAFIRPGEEADESNRNEEIMRAEQVAGPDFVLRMRERYKKAALARVAAQQPNTNTESVDEEDEICPMCKDRYSEPVVVPCGHVFCRGCITEFLDKPHPDEGQECPFSICPIPTCQEHVSDSALFARSIFEPAGADLPAEEALHGDSDSEVDEQLVDESLDGPDEGIILGPKPDLSHLTLQQRAKRLQFLPSTKMRHMMEFLLKLRDERPDEKVIVVSQWTRCLNLASRYLTEKGFYHVKYQGDMTLGKRKQAVDEFMNKDKATIMLMSLRCGGVGLDLKRANHVVNLDLAWSNAVEEQAYGRVHRVGQERPVYVQRLVIKNSVENRILEIQRLKQNLADGILGAGGDISISSWTVQDFATAFGLSMDGSVLPSPS